MLKSATSEHRLDRLAALLAVLWAGAILTLAAIAAPAVFAVASRPDAGRIVGKMFAAEANLGLVVGIALLVLIRAQARRHAVQGQGSQFSMNLALVLGALMCTVLGYHALQPMMAAARLGQGALSFGALHGISAGFFGLKGLVLLALGWRLQGAGARASLAPQAGDVSRPPSS